MIQKKREDTGIVLDFLPHGYPFSNQRTPVIQILGEKYLTILEAVPKTGVFLKPKDKVYIGPEKRDQVHHVVGKINYEKMTHTAKMTLEEIVVDMVKGREKDFVDFFNKAGSLTTRLHQLELIPGIGKKHMWKILEEREEKPFDNFEDIKKRVDFLPDPEKSVIKRIMMEFEGVDKYKLFVG
jgi:putative nucleotide binding protein